MSTKRCPICGNEKLALFTSLKMKYCPDCYYWFPWDLDPGQRPLVGPARTIRKASDES